MDAQSFDSCPDESVWVYTGLAESKYRRYN